MSIGDVLRALGLALLAYRVWSSLPGDDADDADPAEVVDDLGELEPDARDAVEELLAAMSARGWDPRVYETYRPQERQDYLYAQGRTTSGAVVTWTRSSVHTQRRAVDIISASRGWDDRAFFAALGAEAEALGLVWGGRFSTYDGAHVEVPLGWRALSS